MKKLVIGYWLLVIVLLSGCATTTTVVRQGNPDPAGDAYKCVLVKNESPFFVFFSIGTRNVILEPGSEIVTKAIRPLGWFSPTFGNFSFIAYAYRKYENGRFDEFVGQNEYWVYLDGYPRTYQGRVFGDVVIMRYFPVSSFGHPDRWQGSFFKTIPWKAEFKHY